MSSRLGRPSHQTGFRHLHPLRGIVERVDQGSLIIINVSRIQLHIHTLTRQKGNRGNHRQCWSNICIHGDRCKQFTFHSVRIGRGEPEIVSPHLITRRCPVEPRCGIIGCPNRQITCSQYQIGVIRISGYRHKSQQILLLARLRPYILPLGCVVDGDGEIPTRSQAILVNHMYIDVVCVALKPTAHSPFNQAALGDTHRFRPVLNSIPEF